MHGWMRVAMPETKFVDKSKAVNADDEYYQQCHVFYTHSEQKHYDNT
jgi:hypothetical protein